MGSADAAATSAALLAAWRNDDAQRVVLASDHDAIDRSGAARALVLDLLLAGPPTSQVGSRDLYSACARLGRLLADVGASPSFAMTILDGAVRALSDAGVPFDPRMATCRASLAEGYVAAVREAQVASNNEAWAYPRCAVRVDDVTVAIAANLPSDDAEALTDWAAHVAVAAAKHGYRKAIVEGSDRARDELRSAFEPVGIRVVSPTDAVETSRWSRLRFWKS